jgi:hypothetical protein
MHRAMILINRIASKRHFNVIDGLMFSWWGFFVALDQYWMAAFIYVALTIASILAEATQRLIDPERQSSH